MILIVFEERKIDSGMVSYTACVAGKDDGNRIFIYEQAVAELLISAGML